MTETAAEAAALETAVFLVGQHSFDHFLMRDPESQEVWRERVKSALDGYRDAIIARHDAEVRALVDAAKDVVVLQHAGFIGSDVTPEQNAIIRERARRFGEALAPFLERERAK